MKNCLECNKELTGSQRKFCSRGHKSNWRSKNVYGYKYHITYCTKNPRNYLSQLRSYANRKDTLSLDYLENLYNTQKGLCAISREPMTFIWGQGKVATNISIDKINPSLGYTETNIQLVCHRINMMKHDGTLEELKTWCQKVLQS